MANWNNYQYELDIKYIFLLFGLNFLTLRMIHCEINVNTYVQNLLDKSSSNISLGVISLITFVVVRFQTGCGAKKLALGSTCAVIKISFIYFIAAIQL